VSLGSREFPLCGVRHSASGSYHTGAAKPQKDPVTRDLDKNVNICTDCATAKPALEWKTLKPARWLGASSPQDFAVVTEC
jgi:hypothetical protein